MPRVLPQEFEMCHAFAFDLHDNLADLVVRGEQSGLLHFEHPLRTADHAEVVDGLDGAELWEWFEANGYQDILSEYAFRNTIFAVLSDFCHFIYESLRCSEKGKLSVAFALLRKPLRDNLFYLEWLLADRADFLTQFRRGAEHLDVSKIEKNRRIEIIGQAMDRTDLERWVDPEFLHELRYDKSVSHGFDWLCNHALHIVTTFKHYVTDPENLNFVFSDDDDRRVQWKHIYHLLPLILFHAVEITEALFKMLSPEFERVNRPVCYIRRAVSFLLWVQQTTGEDQRETVTSMLQQLQKVAPVRCQECDVVLDFTKTDLYAFGDRGEVRCCQCQKVFVLEDDS